MINITRKDSTAIPVNPVNDHCDKFFFRVDVRSTDRKDAKQGKVPMKPMVETSPNWFDQAQSRIDATNFR